MTLASDGEILALNCGSSSIKFAVFSSQLQRRFSGQIEAIGHGQTPGLKVAGEAARPFGANHEGHADLLPRLVADIIVPRAGRISGVGHRVVHGGEKFTAPERIDVDVRDAISALSPLAPGHQPHNLAGIDAAVTALPRAIQIACFDTAFHSGIAAVRREMALPRAYARKGLIRYGFHGLSYEHVAASLPGLGLADGKKVVACHLGNGSSIAALVDGVSRWTSMGFTPLDGLMMGQRPGRLDPGSVLWLLDQHDGDAGAVADLLYHNSGLLGVSGISGDMRVLLASAETGAAFAIDMYVDRLLQEIGSAIAAIGGCDALVFSGGIGENAAPIRARAISALEWLGFSLDPAANTAHASLLTAASGQRHAFIVRADEERVIANSVVRMIAG